MKKTYLLLCLSFVFGISVKTSAQIAPDAVNLIHQWTFDDGTVNDSKGTLNGVLEGGAMVKNKALNTVNGGYVDFSGADLAINSYTDLTTEVWFTSTAGGNTSYHMLYYFGDTNSSGNGENYTCITPARGNNVSRAMMSTGNSGTGGENGVDGPEYDDGVLHHMVSVVTAYSITFYIDGVNMGAADLKVGNSLAGVGSQFAYLAKGGYKADPTWKGSMNKVSIYNSALTDDNVLYLYQHGAEDQAVIATSASSFAFDNNYPAEMITVTSANLTSPITITAPAGITVLPATLDANSINAELTVIFDGTTAVDGDIVLTSGSTVSIIPVKSAIDEACFVPLYSNRINLIPEPGMNSLLQYKGWGIKSISTIVSDPANVYCGASSIKVGDGINGGSATLDLPLDNMLIANTTYRVKVMAKTDGPFQLGLERIDMHNKANNTILKPINTGGEWQTIDFTFATGDSIAANPVIYINDWSLTGTAGYFDNWEMYATPDETISPTISALAFDPQLLTDSFKVTASNLIGDITLTAPAGITLTPATLPAGAASALVRVTYDGTTVVEGNITLASGTATANVLVKTAASNTTCFTPLYTDRLNLISDPFFNDPKTLIPGWENRTLISILNEPDSVYCGSHSCKIKNRGDVEVPLEGKLLPNYTYISKIMIRTFGGAFKMGINRHDIAVSGDVTDTINTNGEWQEFIFEFNTGVEMTTPVLFINNDRLAGKRAFLDNWELYAKEPFTALTVVKDQFKNLYVQNGKIIADFDLDHASLVRLSVYSIQGALVSDESLNGIAGRNNKVLNAVLPSGVYVVKMTKNGETSFRKLIK